MTLWTRLRETPSLNKRDIGLTILFGLLWLGGVSSRAFLIHPSCRPTPQNPTPCTAERVPAIDRPGIGIENGDADFYSLMTQNSSGVIAATVPVLWHAGSVALASVSPAAALASLGTDWVILTQAAFLNGFLTEMGRVTVQRPRPYVFAHASDPQLTADRQNYTSFYSGHTSFVTVVWVTLLLTLVGRRAPAGVLIAVALAAQTWIISTGVFRILAGRHFLTDVLTAAIMGTLVGIAVALLHRRRDPLLHP